MPNSSQLASSASTWRRDNASLAAKRAADVAQDNQLFFFVLRLAQRADEHGQRRFGADTADAAQHEVADLGNRFAAGERESERPLGIGFGERLGGIPVHERKIVVARVLGVARKGLEY